MVRREERPPAARAGLVLWGLLFAWLVGCAPPVKTVRPYQPDDRSVVRVVAVVPFQRMIPEERSLGQQPFPLAEDRPGEDALAAPERMVEDLFVAGIRGPGKRTVLASPEVASTYRMLYPRRAGKDMGGFLQELGRALQVDAVAVGYVYRFRERRGTPYGVEQPASVAFEICLYRVRDGAAVWRGECDRTQRSLLENVLQWNAFSREGGVWITARDLAALGIEEMLMSFPGIP